MENGDDHDNSKNISDADTFYRAWQPDAGNNRQPLYSLLGSSWPSSTKTPEEHYRMAQRLKALRQEGVLIVGSGNIVHNLAGYNWRKQQIEPPSWAVDFDIWNREHLLNGHPEALIDYLSRREARQSAPTPDHYLPLLYTVAVQSKHDNVSFPVEGFDGGTMSMRSVLLSDGK